MNNTSLSKLVFCMAFWAAVGAGLGLALWSIGILSGPDSTGFGAVMGSGVGILDWYYD